MADLFYLGRECPLDGYINQMNESWHILGHGMGNAKAMFTTWEAAKEYLEAQDRLTKITAILKDAPGPCPICGRVLGIAETGVDPWEKERV